MSQSDTEPDTELDEDTTPLPAGDGVIRVPPRALPPLACSVAMDPPFHATATDPSRAPAPANCRCGSSLKRDASPTTVQKKRWRTLECTALRRAVEKCPPPTSSVADPRTKDGRELLIPYYTRVKEEEAAALAGRTVYSISHHYRNNY